MDGTRYHLVKVNVPAAVHLEGRRCMQEDFSLICSSIQILMSEGVLCSEVVYAVFLLPDFVVQ